MAPSPAGKMVPDSTHVVEEVRKEQLTNCDFAVEQDARSRNWSNVTDQERRCRPKPHR